MILPELLREIENRGVQLVPAGDRLRFRPKRNLTPELVAELREHKAAILQTLKMREGVDPARIEDAGEVLEMARAYFGLLPEDREEPPLPEPEKGHDPLVHRHTAKARFFRSVRGRDLEKRKREGLPPWIRLVNAQGGGGGR
ncbi:MAG: hypothetical protein M3Q60_07330 [Actinomycetota bacterium]|nr:hypothetical protein [Actinomycetota bacterium]